jgi:transcriptional regulator with XRE-family HTH domain
MFDRIEDVGQLLIAARIQRGLTQRQLAERLSVHESQVSRDERHEYQGLTLERLTQLSEALALDPVIQARLRDVGTVSSSLREGNPVAAGSHIAPAAVPLTSSTRPAGYEPTRIPAAPYSASAHALASVRWHAALWVPRSNLNEEHDSRAGLPRVPVVVLTKAQIAGAAGGTAGATGPEGPFIQFSSAYAFAA